MLSGPPSAAEKQLQHGILFDKLLPLCQLDRLDAHVSCFNAAAPQYAADIGFKLKKSTVFKDTARNIMANEIILPKLGQTMQEGTVVNIRVAAGDSVRKGDILFEIGNRQSDA